LDFGTGKMDRQSLIRRQDGVVIIAVLWVCALIMWFALQIGSETRMQGEEQVHIWRKSQATHLAIGGAYEALAHMGEARSIGLGQGLKMRGSSPDEASNDWQPNGAPHIIEYETGMAIVMVEDETQKINVNSANQELLKAVLGRAGLEENDADGLANVIADFVDKDDLPRLRGAEKDHYKQAGLHHVPFDGPLLSLDQLLLVPGINDQLFYGYGPKSEAVSENEILLHPLLPGKHSLFQMLSIYGKNQRLPDEEAEEEFTDKVITWKSGGIYRILSIGKVSHGSQTVLLWLIVRFAPESEKGYDVLYRRIL